VANTGAWTTFQTFTGTLNLPAGTQTLRLECRHPTNPGSSAFLIKLDKIIFATTNNLAGNALQLNPNEASIKAASATLQPATFQLSPNPGREAVRIQLNELLRTQNITVRMTSLTGEVVLQRTEPATGHHTLDLDASQLTPGLYLITITTPEGFRETQKWLKQ
ncbi:MAG: T9SS type A sorting domain-containing protein, partial [Saprospiraceae bacterium]